MKKPVRPGPTLLGLMLAGVAWARAGIWPIGGPDRALGTASRPRRRQRQPGCGRARRSRYGFGR